MNEHRKILAVMLVLALAGTCAYAGTMTTLTVQGNAVAGYTTTGNQAYINATQLTTGNALKILGVDATLNLGKYAAFYGGTGATLVWSVGEGGATLITPNAATIVPFYVDGTVTTTADLVTVKALDATLNGGKYFKALGGTGAVSVFSVGENGVISAGYDAAAYWTATVADGAGVTFNATSDGTADFTFTDALHVGTGYAGTGASISAAGAGQFDGAVAADGGITVDTANFAVDGSTGNVTATVGTIWQSDTLGVGEGVSPSYKGIYSNITVPAAVIGATQYIKALQGMVTSAAVSNPAETWGVYGINNVGGSAIAAYGTVGELTVTGTGTIGTGAVNTFVSAGYFHSDVAATVTISGIQEVPLVGIIESSTGRRKAEAAIGAVLAGALSQSTAGAGAAFKVYDFNTGASFDYGLDLYFSSGSYTNSFTNADIRLSQQETIVNTPDGTISMGGIVDFSAIGSDTQTGLIGGAGAAASTTAVTTAAAGKFLAFYTSSTATSGDSVVQYNRIYDKAASQSTGTVIADRSFVTATTAYSGNLSAAVATASMGTAGAANGLVCGVKAVVDLGTSTAMTQGTYFGLVAETQSGANSQVTSAYGIAWFRSLDVGGTGTKPNYLFAIGSITGTAGAVTSGAYNSDTIFCATNSATITHGLRVLINGEEHYILVADSLISS